MWSMAGWEAGEDQVIDIETLIERIMDAFEYEEFLQIMADDETFVGAIRRVCPELCDTEDFGE